MSFNGVFYWYFPFRSILVIFVFRFEILHHQVVDILPKMFVVASSLLFEVFFFFLVLFEVLSDDLLLLCSWEHVCSRLMPFCLGFDEVVSGTGRVCLVIEFATILGQNCVELYHNLARIEGTNLNLGGLV